MAYYWLSFVDDDRPKGNRFLGGCLVQARSPQDAILEAWQQHCNPGGEVAMIEITPPYEVNVAKFQINRLYSKGEIEAMGEYRTLDQAVEDGDVTEVNQGRTTMLLRRPMLSAKKLKLPKDVVDALIAIRDDLRDGKYPHERLDGKTKWYPVSFHDRWMPSDTVYFNMAQWHLISSKGRMCCIGGLVEARIGYCMIDKLEVSAHVALCYPGYSKESVLIYPLSSSQVHMYEAITPDQAADAIDNFLYEGDPQWARVLATG
jgi:hypothetical protein